VRKDDARRAAGTRWFDQPSPRLPVPPRETSGDLGWPERTAPPDADAPAVAAAPSAANGSTGSDTFTPVDPPVPERPAPGPPGDGDGNGLGVAGAGVAPPREPEPWSPRTERDLRLLDPGTERWLRIVVDVAVVAICVLFVFLQLGPSNLFADTTPAGGDMGAHVWGPAYLRDQLLPNFQLTGWSPDWYAGFPAYQFYMVIPSLLIVVLDLGIQGPLAVVPLAGAVAALVFAGRSWSDRRRRNLLLGLAVLALACVGLPYGVGFKLVSISGVVTMPLSAYLFGRLSGLRFPTPAVLAAATLPFLFYRGFSIYGGNIASTLAGEFAFSMSLSIGLVYLGVLFRGFETGRHRALAAVLLALTGLCHLIPAFWVLGASLVAVLLRWRRSNAPFLPCAALALAGAVFGLVGGLVLLLWGSAGLVLMVLGAALLGSALWLANQSARWLTPVLAVGGLLSAFWVVPFFLRRTYLNDMGWEKLPYVDPETGQRDWWQHLLPSETPDVDLRWAFALAAVGLGLSLALWLRAGIFLGMVSVATGMAFWLLPQGRLWNARVLPFYYLAVILLAGLAIVEAARVVAQLAQPRRQPGALLGAGAAAGTLVVTLLYVGLPLGVIPSSERLEAGGYGWPDFSPLQLESAPESFVPGWANWNYTGYEGKDSYREYYEIVSTMGRLGEQRGCGMAFWEYQKELDRYGTPMALMLLPYWTDGCIGSMEGLYFEASATTPYHFLMQTELSAAPSAAQRDLPYGGFDITRGVQHLQLMGVRYYMATTPQAIQAANTQPDLTQVAQSGPWVVYEVAESDLVIGLINEPAVIEGVGGRQQDWLQEPRDASERFFGPSLQWFLDSQRWDVVLATDGPEAWQRVDMEGGLLEEPEERPVPLAQVSNIDPDSDPQRITFDVDRVGSPVLVKASYFPNWQVDGALGPWRVAPNLMVVVPTETHVELHYENTSVEWLAYALTLVGLVGLVLLARRGMYRYRIVEPTPRRTSVPSMTPPSRGPFSRWLNGSSEAPAADEPVDEPPEPEATAPPIDD
jgi:hypothetical protein